jgi:hypothetical protein
MTQQTELEEDLAFEQGFTDIADAEPAATPKPEKAEVVEPPAADAAATAAPATVAKVEAPAPVEDPFASLPPAVRDLLARVPALEARLEQTTRVANMVPALQSRLDKLNSQPAATNTPVPTRGKFAKVEALRAELPEIADALDEIAAERHQAPADIQPAQRQPAHPDTSEPTAHEEALTSVRPTWADDLVSSDFQLWLARQPKDYQALVQNTSKSGDILKALGQFDAFREQTTSTQQLSQRRSTRMAAAVVPQGDGRRARPAVAEDDEDAAMASAFNKARGGR